jgi:hypothetical protein
MLQLPQMLRRVDHVGSEVSTTDSISEEIHGDPHFTSCLILTCHDATLTVSNKFHMQVAEVYLMDKLTVIMALYQL